MDPAGKLDYVKALVPTPEDELGTPTLEEGMEQTPPMEEDALEQSMDEATTLLTKTGPTEQYENPYLKQPTKLRTT